MTMLGIVAEEYWVLLALIRGVPRLKSLWASEGERVFGQLRTNYS